MASTLRRSIMVILMAIAVVPVSAQTLRKRSAIPKTPTKNDFSINQLEYYLSNDVIGYIRPGVQITVNSVTIGSDRRPVVDFNLTDSFNQPIDRLGQVTPGAVSVSFIIAWYNPATRQYTSYIYKTETAAPPSTNVGATATQATTDSGGQFTDLAVGHATYKFKNALPTGYDPTKTTTVGMYATRDLTAQIGKTYYANAEYNFRPDGGTVTDVWDKINQATSCNNCHDPLSAHGGARQDVKLCVLCHQPQTADADTGNTVDFKVMIHKIHDGSNLPSVLAGTPYQIIGYMQGVNDFSSVVFPQNIVNCQTCHVGSDPTKVPSQALDYLTQPSRAACGSCHDDVNWTTGANHPAGPQADDSACATCHIPDSGQEFDASVKGAHVNPLKSAQLKGISATVVSVSNFAAGQKPTVVISLKNGDGTAIDGTKLDTFAPIYAGPTSSYTTAVRESATTKGTFDPTAGTTTYTFNTPLPATASGTWAVSADVERAFSLVRADGKPNITGLESPPNPVQYFSIDKSPVAPRRTVVATQQCNSCHDSLGLHGGQRKVTDECVMCHNPKNDDSSQRPASAGPPESISLQRMIHKIHTGENLTQNFTIYGYHGSVNTFNDVRFPGDTRDCAKCHVGTSYTLPLTTGIDSVTTLRDYFSPQGPATAACLGCHDNSDAAAHAYLNTVTFPGATTPNEACATCHGTGKDWDVAKVHAR